MVKSESDFINKSNQPVFIISGVILSPAWQARVETLTALGSYTKRDWATAIYPGGTFEASAEDIGINLNRAITGC
jgi:hypothetical protein